MFFFKESVRKLDLYPTPGDESPAEALEAA
jgi:hypothetical protein